MSRRKKGRKTNILLGIICILLVGVLGSIIVISRQAEQKESQRLTELADGQQSGIEDYEAVKEHAEELQKTASEEDETADSDNNTAEKSKKDKDTEEADNTDNTENEETRTISGVVCWGDDLLNGAESDTYSYMAVLQKLLTDNGYNLTVVNKTLQGGGTLSMMKMFRAILLNISRLQTVHS